MSNWETRVDWDATDRMVHCSQMYEVHLGMTWYYEVAVRMHDQMLHQRY